MSSLAYAANAPLFPGVSRDGNQLTIHGFFIMLISIMFEKLQERLEATFKKLKGYGKLNESNIKDSLREVRIALLEADVNYKVAKDFLEKIKEKTLAERSSRALHRASSLSRLSTTNYVTFSEG
jgi:signal recognition particle GTPase